MVIFLPSLSCGNVGATAPGYRKRERAVQLHAYFNNDNKAVQSITAPALQPGLKTYT